MIYVIPDTQSKQNVKNPLITIAYHICDIKPKHVIHLGDHWDLPSLSKYDKGKKSHRVKTYKKDIEAGNKSMAEFWHIIKSQWPRWKEDCTWIILEGNHENRRNIALEYGDDNIYDLMASMTFDLSNWEITVPFLEVMKLHGIEFSHYFCNQNSGRPIASARALLTQRHISCIAGHKQGFEYAEQLQGKDKTIQSFIVGSCYYHDENYKNHTNRHFRGSLLLYNINSPTGFDFARYSLETLDGIYDKHN